MENKLGFDELKGKRINAADKWDVGDKSWTLYSDGGNYELQIDDDDRGFNDSNAFLSGVRGLDAIVGREIVAVDEESDSYGAEIKLRTADGSECVINITHKQNGYYGFSYELLYRPNTKV